MRIKYKRVNNVKIWEDSNGEGIEISKKYLNECIDYIKMNRVKKIDILDFLYKGEDLDFLKECPTVEDIRVDSIFLKDISGLYYLKNLKSLALGESTTVDGKNEIDLTPFTNLRILDLTWTKKIRGISSLENLIELCLHKYSPSSRNLDELVNLKNLIVLQIRTSKVQSLQGIEKLQELQELELSYLRTLEMIKHLAPLDSSLKRLEIVHCKKVKDYEELNRLHSLEWLMLDNCGELESLEFVKRLPELKHFVFPATNVLDGNISPCLHINYCYFDSKKHYSHKWKDIDHWNKQVH
ncbi:leucine-rich repeat domain-containing protein [Metabacillus indicus]|uniref:leucine-rich repeat domain-containing protein n=1 Tax=Metabacillus indicus TaxID=246786 RepID=UPI003177F8AC